MQEKESNMILRKGSTILSLMCMYLSGITGRRFVHLIHKHIIVSYILAQQLEFSACLTCVNKVYLVNLYKIEFVNLWDR